MISDQAELKVMVPNAAGDSLPTYVVAILGVASIVQHNDNSFTIHMKVIHSGTFNVAKNLSSIYTKMCVWNGTNLVAIESIATDWSAHLCWTE